MPKRARDVKNAPLLQFPYDFRWRAAGAIPVTGIHERPYLYCITVEANWLKDVLGAIDRLDEWDAWSGSETEIEYARNQIAILQSTIKGCTVLRQNPNNPCQLEQSIDFGVTWTLAFDYSLCISPADKILLDGTLAQNIADLLAGYVDDILALFPNLTYNGGAGDATLDTALCFSINAYVDIVCDAVISAMSDNNVLSDAVTWSLNAVSEIADFFGGLVPAGNLLAWEIGKIADLIIQSIGTSDISAYQNATARENVACCMFDNLKDSATTVQLADWSDALETCVFSGDELAIADAISATLSSTNVYLTIMQLWSNAVDLANAGLTLPCPCFPELPILVPMLDDQWCSNQSTENYPIEYNGDGTWTILSMPATQGVGDERFMVRDLYNRIIKLTQVVSHTAGISYRVYRNNDSGICQQIGSGYPIDEPINYLGFTWPLAGGQTTSILRFELA